MSINQSTASPNVSGQSTTEFKQPDQTENDVFRPIKLVIYTLIFFGSVAGNGVLVTVILKFRHLRTTANLFVLNLAFCDIMLVLLSVPFGAILEDVKSYPFGLAGCKTLWPGATAAVNTGVLTLVLIAIERFYAVRYPLRVNRFNGMKNKAFVLFIIHGISLATVIPFMIYLRYETKADGKKSCKEYWGHGVRKFYTLFLFLIQYGIPLPVIACLYGSAWNYIRKQNKQMIKMHEEQHASRRHSKSTNGDLSPPKSENGPNSPILGSEGGSTFKMNQISGVNRRISLVLGANSSDTELLSRASLKRLRQTIRTLKMFTCVVVVFAICMLPNQITWMWIDFHHEDGPSKYVRVFFYYLTYTNSVLNPWIYCGINSKFRKAYKRLLGCKSKGLPIRMIGRHKKHSADNGNSRRNSDRRSSQSSSTSDHTMKRNSLCRNGFLTAPLRQRSLDDTTLVSNGRINPNYINSGSASPLVAVIENSECEDRTRDRTRSLNGQIQVDDSEADHLNDKSDY